MQPRRPAHVKIVEGNPGHRPIPAEIDYPTGIKCPTFLDAEARKEWRRIVAALEMRDRRNNPNELVQRREPLWA